MDRLRELDAATDPPYVPQHFLLPPRAMEALDGMLAVGVGAADQLARVRASVEQYRAGARVPLR